MNESHRWWNVAPRVGVLLGLVVVASLAVPPFTPRAQAAPSLTFALSDRNAGGAAAYRMAFGPAGPGVPVVGNWDRAASGRDTIGVSVVSGTGRTWVLASGNTASGTPARRYDFNWGNAACTPVTGNWQGRGDTIGQACKDGATNTWRWTLAAGLGHSGPATFRTYHFGPVSCTPVTGDWNGDGVTTVGVSCPFGARRQWRLTNSPGDGTHDPTQYIPFVWGNEVCAPVTGDWDGLATGRHDGTTVGQVCPSADATAWNWYLSNHNSAGPITVSFTYGSHSQVPITGDWDGRTSATHTNADTPGTAAGAIGPPDVVSAPAANPYGAREVTRGWTPRMQYVVNQMTARYHRGCGGQASGGASGHVRGSDHYSGNAADCTPRSYGVVMTGADRELGDAIAAWVVAYGRILRVKYVIWYAQIYDFQTSGPAWRPYCNPFLTAAQCAHPTPGSLTTLQHYDHVHVSVLH